MPWGVAAAAIGGSVVSGILANDAAETAANATSEASRAQVEEARRQFDLVRGDTKPYREVGESSLYRIADIFGLPVSRPPLNSEERAQAEQLEKEIAELEQLSAGGGPMRKALAATEFQKTLAEKKAQLNALNQTAAQRAGQQGQGQQTGQSVAEMVLASSPGYRFRLEEGAKARERLGANYRGTPRAAKEMERYAQDYASGEFGNFLESQFRLAGLGGNAVNTSASSGANTTNAVNNALAFGAAGQANAAIAGASGVNNAIQGGLNNYLTLKAYNDANRPQASVPFYGVGNAPY